MERNKRIAILLAVLFIGGWIATKMQPEAAPPLPPSPEEVKFGPMPLQSPLDGSYSEVENYLERVANNPSSVKIEKCTQVYKTDDGWVVGCDYRGENALGGMIKKSNWFTIAHGQVVKAHEPSAFKP